MQFTSDHLCAIKKTPFWLFVKVVLNITGTWDFMRFKKRDSNIASTVKRYHVVDGDQGFLFGNLFLTPVKEDIELMFGVRGGSAPVVPATGTILSTGFLRRCFPIKAALVDAKDTSHYWLSPSLCRNVLIAKVKQGDRVHAHDVARVLHLYLLTSPQTRTCH